MFVSRIFARMNCLLNLVSKNGYLLCSTEQFITSCSNSGKEFELRIHKKIPGTIAGKKPEKLLYLKKAVANYLNYKSDLIFTKELQAKLFWGSMYETLSIL
ncbi:hypothetical protein KTGMC3_P1144 [Methanocalculus sp. MC3]